MLHQLRPQNHYLLVSILLPFSLQSPPLPLHSSSLLPLIRTPVCVPNDTTTTPSCRTAPVLSGNRAASSPCVGASATQLSVRICSHSFRSNGRMGGGDDSSVPRGRTRKLRRRRRRRSRSVEDQRREREMRHNRIRERNPEDLQSIKPQRKERHSRRLERGPADWERHGERHRERHRESECVPTRDRWRRRRSPSRTSSRHERNQWRNQKQDQKEASIAQDKTGVEEEDEEHGRPSRPLGEDGEETAENEKEESDVDLEKMRDLGLPTEFGSTRLRNRTASGPALITSKHLSMLPDDPQDTIERARLLFRRGRRRKKLRVTSTSRN
mmetsp:Transcript_9812/g.24140  ORF Transcript_9812/g.24140 Transcript_9812/m.24140 type:complete len:326 (+) Transcript_9812:374-1351(+)